MKLDHLNGGETAVALTPMPCSVLSEADWLTDVLLCAPNYLSAVPCCSVTREALRGGFTVSSTEARSQHDQLVATLERHGVRCHLITPDPKLPDMCFTRDILVTTPWGVLELNPYAAHRRDETARARAWLRTRSATIAGQITNGHAEGGDIAIIRNGLVIIGCSGDRTDEAGAVEVAALFRRRGWVAEICRFDPHFLHLDTQFALVDHGLALACRDVLSEEFLRLIERAGIEMIDVSYKEHRRLGCNILSLGGGRVISSVANERVNRELRSRGLTVEELTIDQFSQCGGGVHCLTMPLLRTAAIG